MNLDPLLHEAVVNRKEGYKETLRWDEIFSRLLGKMAPAVRITKQGSLPVIRKGKLQPIDIAVAKRSGNKKVGSVVIYFFCSKFLRCHAPHESNVLLTCHLTQVSSRR